MNGFRLSITYPGADAGHIVRAGRLADRWGVGGLWIGDPVGTGAPNSDDSYLTAVAGALGSATEALRIGLFLTLAGTATPLRLAEDIGVADQAAGGRLEIGLVAPFDGGDAWEAEVHSLLTAWNGWPDGEDDEVAVLPYPAQPWLPRAVAGRRGTAELADRLRAGLILDAGAEAPPATPGVAARRHVALVRVDTAGRSLAAWVAADLLAIARGLRARASELGAQEILLELPTPSSDDLTGDMRALGSMVVPCLRGADNDVDNIAADSRRFWDRPLDPEVPLALRPGARRRFNERELSRG